MHYSYFSSTVMNNHFVSGYHIKSQVNTHIFDLHGATFTVSGGRRPRISIKALYICSAVPSKNLPQPATNNVSPACRKRKKKQTRKRDTTYIAFKQNV